MKEQSVSIKTYMLEDLKQTLKGEEEKLKRGFKKLQS